MEAQRALPAIEFRGTLLSANGQDRILQVGEVSRDGEAQQQPALPVSPSICQELGPPREQRLPGDGCGGQWDRSAAEAAVSNIPHIR